MKKHLADILVLILVSTLSVACAKPEQPVDEKDIQEIPDVAKTEIVFEPGQELNYNLSVDQAYFYISFTSTHYWSAQLMQEASWIRLHPSYGSAGEGKFAVQVDENETLDARDARIVIAYGDSTKTISVHQDGRTRLKYSYSGSELIEPFTQAYEYFIDKDLMPETVEICGETLKRGPYFELMHRLLSDISKGGDEWKTLVYANPKCRESNIESSTKYDTFAPDSIDLQSVISLNERQLNYAGKNNNVLANYCSVDNTTFSLTRSIVVTSRILYSFFKNGQLPETVSSWQSDFLRDIEYHNVDKVKDTGCSLQDPDVVSARNKAINGKTTEMEKAVAIFEFTRDEWEWEDYYNTAKGAKEVIRCKGGNCCDLTHGMIAIARSAGIPARYVHGPETYYPSGSIWGHVWAELYVDGKWYICDASNNGCSFGTPVWDLEKTIINGKYRDLLF